MRPGIFGATVHTPQLTATLYRYGRGLELGGAPAPSGPDHDRARGRDRLRGRGRARPPDAGQLATLPGDTPHSAAVPSDGTGAVTLNVFTHRDSRRPVSDWLGLTGQRALIAGGGGTIGRALVDGFVTAGATVAVVDVTERRDGRARGSNRRPSRRRPQRRHSRARRGGGRSRRAGRARRVRPLRRHQRPQADRGLQRERLSTRSSPST